MMDMKITGGRGGITMEHRDTTIPFRGGSRAAVNKRSGRL
jgi:hypothetical protein